MASEEEAGNARALLTEAIEGFLHGHAEWAGRGGTDDVPGEVRAAVERLCDAKEAYKDAALTVLAFPAANGLPWNVTERFERDRGLSNWLGEFLKAHDIPAVGSALQNASFRGGFAHERIRSDDLRTVMRWANDPTRTTDEIRAVVFRIARRRAEAARATTELPRLFAQALAFDRTLAVYEQLLSAPSGGAAEQYAFAGLLQAYMEGIDEKARVVSKDINAADAGRVAGDVQVVHGQAEVTEAYEVSAAHWAQKLDQAVSVVRQHGLARAHVVAADGNPSAATIRSELDALVSSTLFTTNVDVSVLDLRSEVRSLIAKLSKSGRKRAIEHTWLWLAQYAPDLTDRLVDAVIEVGVVEA